MQPVDKLYIKNMIKGYLGEQYKDCLIIDLPEDRTIDIFVTTSSDRALDEPVSFAEIREYLKDMGYLSVRMVSDVYVKKEVASC